MTAPSLHRLRIYRSNAPPGGTIGSLQSFSLATKSSWLHLGEWSPSLLMPLSKVIRKTIGIIRNVMRITRWKLTIYIPLYPRGCWLRKINPNYELRRQTTNQTDEHRTPDDITSLSRWLQETQLSLTNRATRLEVSQGHQTWYHYIC